MIDKIVLGLLAVACLSCTSTKAQLNLTLPTLPPTFPTLDPNVVSACNSYTPKASFANITGYGYVAEYSAPLDCLSLNVQTFKPGVIYNSTYFYNNNGSLVSPAPSILFEKKLKPGQAQSYRSISLGALQLVRITVIVGYVGDSSGFRGYALVACRTDGSKEVAIVVKNKLLQDNVVEQLKEQLKDYPLQDVPLKVIFHGDNCTYPLL